MKKQARAWVVLLATVAGMSPWDGPCMADPEATRSLENSLLDNSQSPRLAPMKPSRAGADGRGDTSAFPPARVTRQSFWADELGVTRVSDDVLPLLSVAGQMRDVQKMLGRAECGATTQHAQRQIVDSLDRLLLEAQERCGAAAAACDKGGDKRPPDSAAPCGKPGDGQKPGMTPDNSGKAPAGADGRQGGGAPRLDAGQRQIMLKRLWGELPPRQREQMLQLPVEEFLPQYEIMIEDYFRRLSEQKGTNEAGR